MLRQRPGLLGRRLDPDMTKGPLAVMPLHMPLDAVSRDCVNGDPSGLEMIRLLRARVQELEKAVEALLRHEKA